MKLGYLLIAAAVSCGSPSADNMGLTGSSPPDAGSPDAPRPSSATLYRFRSLGLADPHIWFGLGDVCIDVTDIVNNVATNVLQVDSSDPPDGKLDGSLAIAFRPLVTTPGSSTAIDIEVPVCTAPATMSTCTATAATPKHATTVVTQDTGSCLDALPSTAAHPPEAPAAPCFASAAQTLEVDFLGAAITLVDARGAASYDGDLLRPGLIRGFLSRTDAEALQFTINAFGIGTRSVASLLYGGGSCHDDQTMGDMDVGPDGQLGWYIYLAFAAEKTPYFEE